MLAEELSWANSPVVIALCWVIIVAAMVGLYLIVHIRRKRYRFNQPKPESSDDLCKIEDEDPPIGNGDPWTVWCRKVKGDDDGVA